MTSCAAPVAHAGRTRRRPGRRDSGGALPVRWSVGYPDRPRMPAAGLRRPPSRSARTTWPLWGSSLRAPSVAGDLPPPHRRTGFPQPPATLLPPDRARQACDPAARAARRSAAPQQQHQPSLRAAASSSAEHGQIGRAIFMDLSYSPFASQKVNMIDPHGSTISHGLGAYYYGVALAVAPSIVLRRSVPCIA